MFCCYLFVFKECYINHTASEVAKEQFWTKRLHIVAYATLSGVCFLGGEGEGVLHGI